MSHKLVFHIKQKSKYVFFFTYSVPNTTFLKEVIVKMKSGEGSTIDLPNPELFDCSICGVSVKYKREHLNKKHQVNKMSKIK